MKFSKERFFIFILYFGLVSCSLEEGLELEEQKLKSYELISLQWKLKGSDGQSIVEQKLPTYNFQNNSNSVMEVVIEPLKNLRGNSTFTFDDALAFSELNYSEVLVAVPKELSLLSPQYSYISGGVELPLKQETSNFPFSSVIKDTYSLNEKTKLTSNYTIFLMQNEASFIAKFKEKTSGDFLKLEGTWKGLFFNSLEESSVIKEID